MTHTVRRHRVAALIATLAAVFGVLYVTQAPASAANLDPYATCGILDESQAAGTEACWETNTGYHTSAGMTVVNGGVVNLTTDNMTYSNAKLINGACINVQADHVNIENVWILGASTNCSAGGDGAAAPAMISTGSGNELDPDTIVDLDITDVEVDGQNTANMDVAGIGATDYDCLRCNVSGYRINMWATVDVSIVRSYVHDPSDNTTDPLDHSDGINASSPSNVNVTHSYVMNVGAPFNTGALFLGAAWGAGDTVVVYKNHLQGGSGVDLPMDCGHTNVTVRENRFSTNSAALFNGWNMGATGNQWLTNKKTGGTAVAESDGCP